MRQLIANLQTGELELLDVPGPRPGPGEIVVANEWSVVSPGTERMLLGFARASLPGKALREPARVRQALQKVATQGVGPTARSVATRLEQPQPLGYSAAGVVLELGEGVSGFRIGDRVATNAAHAEIAVVWARHAARIPEEVDSRDAAWGTLGAVALNAFRLAGVDTGGTVAVIGLGLLGQLATRIAHASGCSSVGLDPIRDRAAAIATGTDNADAFEATIAQRTHQAGADAVIVTAPGTRETLELAARSARVGATIVVVGAGDLAADRRLFYERELQLVVAHSYGPGRDEGPWERGEISYPRHRVRWTAQRNLAAVLELLAGGQLRVDDIACDDVPFDEAPTAYDAIIAGTGPVATTFRYPAEVNGSPVVNAGATDTHSHTGVRSATETLGIAVIGAGTFASHTLLPVLAEQEIDLRWVASRKGVTAATAARRFECRATTDVAAAIEDPKTDVVFIATSHETHVDLAVQALQGGKHVWLEKPMAINREGLGRLESACTDAGTLMVGFNRRFAPTTRELFAKTRGLGPLQMVYTVNAGALPADHWLIDRKRGGGRLVGEGCHFVDLVRFITDSEIVRAEGGESADAGWFALEFADGSFGTVNYTTTGHPRAPKERLEVSAGGKTWVLDNFRRLESYEDGFDVAALARNILPATQDKGHEAAVKAFLQAVRSGEPSPVSPAESIEVSRAIFDALGR
jgi:predicted dehydrogenase